MGRLRGASCTMGRQFLPDAEEEEAVLQASATRSGDELKWYRESGVGSWEASVMGWNS